MSVCCTLGEMTKQGLNMISKNIQNAVLLLKQGELVAMPTETVYGLAADAQNPDALNKIFHAKGRPINHPLIVHIADISQLFEWATDVSPQAIQLAKHFWPGPLTLILKKAPQVSNIITGGQETIGIRIPKHPIARDLLIEFGSGVAAPSANRFGRISPTNAIAVKEELGDRIKMILDGGQCDVGVESTIVDVSGEHPRILRPGIITPQQIEAVLQQHLSSSEKNIPKVSGSLESHYAPETLTFLMNKEEIQIYLNKQEIHVVVVCRETSSLLLEKKSGVTYVVMPKDADKYAHDLYQTLRDLDKQHFKKIIVENVPETGEWWVVRDRLQRAASTLSIL